MKSTNFKFVTLAAILTASTSAFAGERDLKTFDALMDIGFATESFMSQTHVGIGGISCSLASESGETRCTLRDNSANGGEGEAVTLDGKKAGQLIDLLTGLNAPSDSGMGHFWISAQSIYCHQANVGADPDSGEAERTSCDIRLAD